MSEPLISVIVPVYNVEKYLDRCVKSIVEQTYQNIEILLMDDASPDNCGKICDKWAEKDSRIRVYHLPHGGISATRNAGLKESRGEYISFVDSDDYICSDMICSAYSNMKKYDANMVIFDFLNFYGETAENITERNKNVGIISQEQVLYKMYGKRADIIYLAWNKLYKRNLFDGIRYPEGRIYEDNAVAHKLIEKCSVIVYDENQYYMRQMRADSIMGKSNNSFKPQNMQILYAMKERCELYRNLDNRAIVAMVYAQYFHTLIDSAYNTVYVLKSNDICNKLQAEFCKIYDEIKKEIIFDKKKTVGYFTFRYFPRFVLMLKKIVSKGEK